MVTAYLSLGSNIDDRMAFLQKAETVLDHHPEIKIIKTSKVYETEPWPAEGGQGWFLNQVLEIKTKLDPQELLELAKKIEKKIGRTKSHHWGPREIDVDILLYNDQVIDSPELEIPHRHMRDRQFVLVPLVEIAPDLKDPVSKKTFKKILEEVKETNEHKVTPFL